MRDRLREFNYAPRPKLGQSFASYIENLAADHIPPLDILTLLYKIGIISDNHYRSLPLAYGLTLTDEQIQNMAYVLRLPESRIRETLLTYYDGIAFDLSQMDVTDSETYASAVRKNSTLFTTPRLCPQCMDQFPYFRLVHRLPWLFLCSTHQILLSHTCPRCSRPFGNFSQNRGGMPTYAADIPDPSCCRNPPARGEANVGRAAKPCGQPLAAVDTYDVSSYFRVLETQAVLEKVIETRKGIVCGEEVSSTIYFSHLRSILSLLDYAADPEDLGEGLPPLALEAAHRHAIERGQKNTDESTRRQRSNTSYRTPEWMCAFLPTAVELIGLPNQTAICERLIPLLNQARRFKKLHFRMLGHYFKFEGVLLRAFDNALISKASPRRRTGYTSPFSHHPDRPYVYHPDYIPQLFWEETYRTEFATLFAASDIGERYIRSVISMDLVRLCGKYGWLEAANELGFLPGQATGSANKAIGFLNVSGKYGTYLTRLHTVALRLENVKNPFNFGKRREKYSTLVEFQIEEWRRKMRSANLNPGKPGGKNKWAAAHAWGLLTAGHPRRAPVFQRLSGREYDNQLEVFYRFNRDYLDEVWPLIFQLAKPFEDNKIFAANALIGTQEHE